MRPEDCTLIGIDWGTSRLRAFQIDNSGQILERRRSEHGIAGLAPGDFDAALSQIVAGWPTGVPILMCGMIGSRQGWQEVPYRPCPAGAGELANTLFRIAPRAGPAWIIPGLSTQEVRTGSYDVMRGEETLIVGAGLSPTETLVITPGTHSKWSISQGGKILRFRTCMTGEIYALLQRYSILGRSMEPDSGGAYDERAFLEGVTLGLDEPAMLHSLFSVRTQHLLGQRPSAELQAYLSGILIGSEVSGEAPRVSKHDPTLVIADPELGHLYRLALTAAGFVRVEFLEAEDAVAKGLWTLWQYRGATS